MNLFQNYENTQRNIHVGEKEHILVNEALGISYDVARMKNIYGDNIDIEFLFSGDIEVKIGISRTNAYSFQWVYDKRICNENNIKPKKHICSIDISDYESGILEITFIGNKESVVLESFEVIEEKQVEDKNVLYDFSFPTFEVCCEEPLYYRIDGSGSYYSFNDKKVYLTENSKIDFLTYFNSFSAIKWMEYTNIRTLKSYIVIKGKAYLSVVEKTEECIKKIKTYKVDAENKTSYIIDIDNYADDSILGLYVEAISEVEIYGGGWLSEDRATQQIKLGIGITTFKREKAVVKAVKRLCNAIANSKIYKDDIDIVVIDNGNTLKEDDVAPARLVANKNTGGTGGFIKSLLLYDDEKIYSHCLFMDDDAFCEETSIFRSIAFLSHAKDKSLSLSGAMLFENIKFLQWENGAYFDAGCHSYNRDFDLRDVNKLYENENGKNVNIYGAWWFFMFPIKEAKNMPFPFFVRGDDIDFSYSNDFNVVTLNGVSCWQQDFKSKENPLSIYLFIRSHIIHYLTIDKLGYGLKKIKKILKNHFFLYNNSYMYSSAACVNYALQSVMNGPKFFKENIVPDKILKKIKELSKYEMQNAFDQDFQNMNFVDKNKKTKVLPVFIRKISLYGHLLPKFMFDRKENNFIHKWMTPNPKRMYMHEKITVVSEILNKKVDLVFNRKAYFKNLLEFIRLMLVFRFSYNNYRREYISYLKEFRSKSFWKKVQ